MTIVHLCNDGQFMRGPVHCTLYIVNNVQFA